LATIESAVKPTTFANYSIYATAYVLPVIGDRKLQDIDTATVNALYRHLLTSGRSRTDTNTAMYEHWRRAITAGRKIGPTELATHAGVTPSAAANAIRRYRAGRIPAPTTPGLSPRAVASVHVMFRRALRDAVNWRYLRTNPAATARPPRAEKREHDTWNPAQLNSFLHSARSERLYAMWLLFASTGLRRSEAVGARRDALDLTAGTISLVTTHVIAAGQTHVSHGKTRRSRRLISLDTATIAALADHLHVLDDERAAWGSSYHDHGLLFCWPDGRAIYPDTITEQFGRLVTRAELPIIRLHDIRHHGPPRRRQPQNRQHSPRARHRRVHPRHLHRRHPRTRPRRSRTDHQALPATARLSELTTVLEVVFTDPFTAAQSKGHRDASEPTKAPDLAGQGPIGMVGDTGIEPVTSSV
jgi:integrase